MISGRDSLRQQVIMIMVTFCVCVNEATPIFWGRSYAPPTSPMTIAPHHHHPVHLQQRPSSYAKPVVHHVHQQQRPAGIHDHNPTRPHPPLLLGVHNYNHPLHHHPPQSNIHHRHVSPHAGRLLHNG